MGPIQTAIGQMLGAVGGAAVLGKKLNEKNEKQAAKEQTNQEEQAAKDKKTLNKAIAAAQQSQLDKLNKQVYLLGKEPIGTSSEMASVLSSQSLQNATSSKSRAREKVRARKQALMKRKLVSK